MSVNPRRLLATAVSTALAATSLTLVGAVTADPARASNDTSLPFQVIQGGLNKLIQLQPSSHAQDVVSYGFGSSASVAVASNGTRALINKNQYHQDGTTSTPDSRIYVYDTVNKVVL